MSLKYLVSLSGGMDSATALGWAVEQAGAANVNVVAFDYGSKHSIYELAAAYALARHYGVRHTLLDMRLPAMELKSNLLQTGEAIPEGHYEDKNMSLTVVPGRNTIFAAMLLGIAQSRGFNRVVLGIHSGDHAIYPDCRPAWAKAMDSVYLQASEGSVLLETPLLTLNKGSILSLGYGFKKPVPYEMTRTCYKEQRTACGKCGSCQERLEAFASIGQPDPIFYESRTILPKAVS